MAKYKEGDIFINHNIFFCGDFHLGVRLWYYANKVVTINKIYYNYRQVSSSLIHNVNTKSEEDERRVYLDIIDFFKKEGEYKTYKKCLDWRLLKSAKGLLRNIQTHKEFSIFYSISNNIPGLISNTTEISYKV